MFWKIKNRRLDLARQSHVMGILNVTPDSFSDGGKFQTIPAALAHARKMIAEGAAIIDVGGESTRPGALPVGKELELARTIPVIRALRSEWDGFISIDTTKASVARQAIEAGADIVNDISGLTADPSMASVCADSDCGIIVMHMQGSPRDMQLNPSYGNVCGEIRHFFEERLAMLESLGIDPSRLCFDPGIGFGKSLEHNLALLRHIEGLAPPGSPLLLGISRKSFLSKITDACGPGDRDAPTIALTTYARGKNVMLHRVHSVRENLQALRSLEALLPQ